MYTTRSASPATAVTPNSPATTHSTRGLPKITRPVRSSSFVPPPPLDPARDADERHEVHEPADIPLGDGTDTADGRAAGRCARLQELEVGRDLGQLRVADLPFIERGHRAWPEPDCLSDLRWSRIEERRGDLTATDGIARPAGTVTGGARRDVRGSAGGGVGRAVDLDVGDR